MGDDDKPSIMEKVDDERTLTQKIMKLIPGWRGYRIKEERRNADRILRDQIVSRLRRSADKIEDIRAAVVEEEIEDAYKTVDSLMSRTEKLISQIEHADYGYRPFFDAIKIKEDDLENMLRYDTWFIEQVQAFDQNCDDALVFVEDDPDKASGHIKDLRKMISEMNRKWKDREQVIMGVETV
ncbi:MAG: hypothetical protein ACFFDU_02580 [Candidatus Thorarchaeota archaeon]